MQDGAGTDIVTVSTNKVCIRKGESQRTKGDSHSKFWNCTLDLAQGNFFEFTLVDNLVTMDGHSQTLQLLEPSSWIIKLLSTHQVLRQLHTHLRLNGQEEQTM